MSQQTHMFIINILFTLYRKNTCLGNISKINNKKIVYDEPSKTGWRSDEYIERVGCFNDWQVFGIKQEDLWKKLRTEGIINVFWIIKSKGDQTFDI